MPFSACSTCHNQPTAEQVPEPVATATTDPGSPTQAGESRPSLACIQNQGDKGMYCLQGTIDQRQAAMHAKYDNVAAALALCRPSDGLQQPASPARACRPMSLRRLAQHHAQHQGLRGVERRLSSRGRRRYTDWTYISAEGSWASTTTRYDSLVIEAALNFANQVNKTPADRHAQASKTSVKKNTKVKFSGTVKPVTAGTITIQKKSGKNWLKWKTAKVSSRAATPSRSR